MNTTTYRKNLSEPWFSLIKLKMKTVEGRLNCGDFANILPGDHIIFANNDFAFTRVVDIVITNIFTYTSFADYLHDQTLEKALPGIDSVENGVTVYRKYYSEENEHLFGVKVISFAVIM